MLAYIVNIHVFQFVAEIHNAELSCSAHFCRPQNCSRIFNPFLSVRILPHSLTPFPNVSVIEYEPSYIPVIQMCLQSAVPVAPLAIFSKYRAPKGCGERTEVFKMIC